MDRENARREVRKNWRTLLTRMTPDAKAKVNGEKSYVCPFCGHGTNGDGLTCNPKSADGNGLKCFGCGFSGDIIDLYEQAACVDYNEALSALAAELGIEIDSYNPMAAERSASERTGADRSNPAGSEAEENLTEAGKTAAEAAQVAGQPDFMAYYRECRSRINDPAASAYLKARGISAETAAAYWLGYDPEADPAHAPGGNGKAVYPTPRIILPINSGYYVGRAIRDSDKFKKMNPQGCDSGIFNLRALYAQEAQEVFVVEGVFDALSVLEVGASAIALNSAGNKCKLIEQLEVRRTEATMILCLDNDAAGNEAAETIRQGLQRLSVRYVDADIRGPYQDPNEYLQEDRDGFIDAVQRAQANIQPGAAEVEAFLRTIYTEQYRPIPTGVKSLDKLLHGGLIPQTLIFLGAEPGAGKTCLASMIFENMAKSGHRALYFNLEMSREQLMARSVARIAYVNNNWPIDALDVLQGYRQDEDTKAVVMAAAETYKEEIAGRLQYNPGDTTTNVSEILDYMEKEAKEADRKGEPAPNVCIDYLQIMTGTGREDAGETIKRAVAGLKRYAKRWNAIVFCIMAQSRKVNDSGIPTLAAGRDTSAIEYSGDLQMQLTREDVDGQTELTLYVTKSRFTQTNMKHGAKFILHGGQSYLEEAGAEGKDRYQDLFSDVPMH